MRVLVADQTVAAICRCSRLHIEQVSQVLEDLHLVAVVFTVILDMPLGLAQLTHDSLLLLLLDLEVFVEGLHVGHEPLVRVGDVLRFALDSFLESFKDVRLHVVRMELGLGLLVLLELRAHVFGDLLLFSLHLLNDSIVVLLFALVLIFNLGHLLTDGSQLFNTRRQLRLLFLHLLLDLLDQHG